MYAVAPPGSLALRGAAVPIPLNALLLAPPPPPVQGLPPVDEAAADEAAAAADNVIEVTVTQPAAAAAPTDTRAAAAAEPVADEMPPPISAPPPPPPPSPQEEEEYEKQEEDNEYQESAPPPPPPPPPTDEGSEKGPHHPPTTGDCRLMGPFAIFVQLGLGGLALMSLVFKRWRERPQRPVKIWFFDVSKQVFGSVLVHMANVFMSLLTSGRFNVMLVAQDVGTAEEPYVPNPCSFYLLNLGIDTTLGIPILIFLLRATTAVVSYTPLGRPLESIQSGNYGRPPNAWWWLKQSIIYFFGLFGMKFCVLIIFLTMPWISRVGDWALSWTDGNEQLQIVFVMMLFPLIMNGMQYYIIDSFIKGQTAAAVSPEVYDPLADSADDEGSEDEDGDDDDNSYIESSTGNLNGTAPPVTTTTTATTSTKKGGVVVHTTTTTPDPEYNPAVDGDSSTIIGSTSSQRSRPGSRAAAGAGGGAAIAGSVPKERY